MKQLILITALLASSSSWGACISGDCYHGIGTYIFASGDKYVGEYQDGKKHGQGTYTTVDGDKYVGEFQDDKQHGQGTYIFADGEKYAGEFQDGKKHGQGTYTFTDGESLSGDWENDSYIGILARIDAWKAKERTRKAKEEVDRKPREEARQKYNRIYNACLLDKSSDVDMQVSALRIAVEETCEAIAEDPSWYENWKYN